MSLESTTPLFVKKEHQGLFNKGVRSLIPCNPSIFLPLPNTPRAVVKPSENPKRTMHSKAKAQWVDAASSIVTKSSSEFGGIVLTLQAEKVKCARRMKQLERLDKFTLASRIMAKVLRQELTDGDLSELTCLTATLFSFFSVIPIVVQRPLCANMKLLSCKKGDVVCQQGTPGDNFYAIVDGKIDVVVDADSGATTKMATLDVGSTFGEMALLSGSDRTASCVVHTHVCHLLIINKAVFLDIFHSKFMQMHSKTVEFLRTNVRFFQKVSVDDCTTFAHYLKEVTYPNGYKINVDTANVFCIIQKGICSLNARRTTVDKNSAVRKGDLQLTQLIQGQVFGESCVFPELQHGWFVRTETRLLVYQIPINLFLDHTDDEVKQLIRDESHFRNSYYCGRFCISKVGSAYGSKVTSRSREQLSTSFSQTIPSNKIILPKIQSKRASLVTKQTGGKYGC